jgi:hypothetical protein
MEGHRAPSEPLPLEEDVRKMARRVVVSSFVSLFLVVAALARAGDATPSFKVIANPSVAGNAVPREVLAQVYLGAVARWAKGGTISAVDLSSVSPVRQAFSEQVLGMPIDAVKHHWLRKITSSGQRPPLSKSTDEDVIAFVAGQQGAVGYVSVTTVLPPTVHELTVQ